MNHASNESVGARFANHEDIDLIEYPKVSARSVVGLLLGVTSPLALVSPLFWVIPLVGVVVCGLALRQVRTSGRPVSGRTAALVGLALALFCGTAGLSKQASHSWSVRREARLFCRQWFELLAQGQPQKAYQLIEAPGAQQPLDDGLWEHYRKLPEARAGLQQFVQNPLVRALLALEDRAQIGYWKTERQIRLVGPLFAPIKERISQFYSVTYSNGHHRTTFFARLATVRTVDRETGRAGWQVVGYTGGVRPDSVPTITAAVSASSSP